jgi:hypothetical protein
MVMRGLAELGYSGAVNLMSGRHGQLLQDLRMVGERHGLRMLPALVKPINLASIIAAVSPRVAECARHWNNTGTLPTGRMSRESAKFADAVNHRENTSSSDQRRSLVTHSWSQHFLFIQADSSERPSLRS